MPKRQGKKQTSGIRSERRNGKAPKKNPGVAPSAHNGKSVGGYSKAKRNRHRPLTNDQIAGNV